MTLLEKLPRLLKEQSTDSVLLKCENTLFQTPYPGYTKGWLFLLSFTDVKSVVTYMHINELTVFIVINFSYSESTDSTDRIRCS